MSIFHPPFAYSAYLRILRICVYCEGIGASKKQVIETIHNEQRRLWQERQIMADKEYYSGTVYSTVQLRTQHTAQL